MVKAIFQLKRFKGLSYNIFGLDVSGNPVDSQKTNVPDLIRQVSFQGYVYDQNMRIWYKSYPLPTVHSAVIASRDIIKNLNKNAIPHGIKVDEGRSIIERELNEHMEAQRIIRKQKRQAKRK